VAYAYAARHPDRVDRLVLAECGEPPDTPEFRAQIQAWWAFPDVDDDPQEAVDVFVAAGFGPSAAADGVRHWVVSGLPRQEDGRGRDVAPVTGNVRLVCVQRATDGWRFKEAAVLLVNQA